jgi:UDP-2,3-diacylglucosamine hydrolase
MSAYCPYPGPLPEGEGTIKPQQDMRFDVPAIGLGTLETLHAAGGKVLAVEAGRTIFLGQPAVIEFADREGLVIVAVANP